MVYTAEAPVNQLHSHQVLALINRYAKLKNYFYYADIDVLYDIKDSNIREWVKAGEMVATKVIQRANYTFEAMKTTIALHGEPLEPWDDDHFDTDNFVPEDVQPILRSLWDLVENGVCIFRDKLLYESELVEYLAVKAIYDAEIQRRQPIQSEYSKICNRWKSLRWDSVCKWAKENKLNPPTKSKRKRDRFIAHAQRLGFSYPPIGVTKPVFTKLICPKAPEKEEYVTASDYQIGMDEEVDTAIIWMKNFAVEIGEIIDADYKCWNSCIPTLVEDHYRQVSHQKATATAIEVMREALFGRLTAKQIWDKLSDLRIDYENAIGMKCRYNFQIKSQQHRGFSKWHEINLSLSGYWLVEFQSTVDSTVIFHVPYDRVSIISAVEVNQLPVVHSEQEHYGCEISEEEQNNYPLLSLLSILGYTEYDFPRGLKKYVPRQHYHHSQYYVNDWDELDDFTDQCDED